jgi:hypothetical protein
MALLEEVAEVGGLTIGGDAAAALQKILNAQLQGGGATASLTEEEQTALDKLKAEFADEKNCKKLRQLLMDLGILGCGVSRRIKAIGAALGFTDAEMRDCLKDPPKEDKPTPQFVPTEDIAFTPGDEEPDAEGEGDGCETDDPSGEDTEDLPDTDDCKSAGLDVAQMSDIALPPNLTAPLLTPTTYLSMIYRTINIKNWLKDEDCPALDKAIDDFLYGLADIIPLNYINHKLLPEWWPDAFHNFSINVDGTRAQKINFPWDSELVPDTVYKTPGEGDTPTEYFGFGAGHPTPPIGEADDVIPTENETPADVEALAREDFLEELQATNTEALGLLPEIALIGISPDEAAPWIDRIDEGIRGAKEIGDYDLAWKLEVTRREITAAAANFTGDVNRDTPIEFAPEYEGE